MFSEFSRTELLIGEDALQKLKKCKVAIYGVGGVGSFVVEGLVRSGVGKFVLIDNDVVDITNINRQLHATSKTIGRVKVEVMRDRILEINPSAEVEAIRKFYLPGCAMDTIQGNEDYIVDAIDTVTAKIDLIVNAKKLGIPVISAMGAGNKLDPTQFEVCDIYKTSVCPLAKVMRRELRKRDVTSLKVVYSKEQPIKPNDPGRSDCIKTDKTIDSSYDVSSYDTAFACSDESKSRGVKRQTPGSISFVPSVAGLIIAGEVVKDLIK